MRSSKIKKAFAESIDGLILVVKTVKDAGELAPFPYVKSAAGIVLTLLETVRTVDMNEKAFLILAQDATNWIKNLTQAVQGAPAETTTNLKEAVDDFTLVLTEVSEEVTKLCNRSYTRRLFHYLSDADAIKELREKLNQAFRIFMTTTQIQIQQEQRRIAEIQLLATLPVASAGWDQSKKCLEGTRLELLEEIRTWAQDRDPSAKPIYWLADVAGSGKSTIANHMAHEWKDGDMLGGCFFFSRGFSERTNIKLFSTTLCSDLASLHPDLRSIICKAIETTPSIASKQFLEQLNTLIVEPLTQLRRRVVFLIDALDECEIEARSLLLTTLLAEASKSPFIKLFMTSRPEADLSAKLATSPLVRGHFNLYGTSNKSDVHRYIKFQLSSLGARGIFPLLPTDEEIDAIAARADGLFIWASTACRLIEDSINPTAELTDLINSKSAETLDGLYLKALRQAAPADKPRMEQEVVSILNVILLAQEPLSIDAIDQLLGINNTQNVVKRLACVLRVSHNRSEPVQTLHPTFRELLTSPERCTDKSFLVDLKGTHTRLSRRCLDTLHHHLRQDICDIKDSGLLNSQIPDLEKKVARALPEALRYACRFWPDHAAEAIENTQVQDLALQFFKTHCLHWLEALSLMQRVAQGGVALFRLENQFKRKVDQESNTELLPWCHDALRFVQAHQYVIQASALHVYISALAFTPRSALIFQHYAPSQSRLPKVIRGQDDAWSAQLALASHEYAVTCIAFSPDGARIASGSFDNTVRLWDAVSGSAVGQPLVGHTEPVNCIAFSPDGARIASGSGDLWDFPSDNTVRLWDAVSGSAVGQPLVGHTSPVNCIAFSPDGARLASGSYNTVRLWDASSGLALESSVEGKDWFRAVGLQQPVGRSINGWLLQPGQSPRHIIYLPPASQGSYFVNQGVVVTTCSHVTIIDYSCLLI